MNKKLDEGLNLTYQKGLAAWKLREPSWAWRPAPLKAMVLRYLETPIAVARTFPRVLVSRDVSIPVMGIGGVYVEREYRRRGFGRLVIVSTCQRFKDEGVYAACLYANETYKWLYKNLGFEEVQPGFMIKSLRPRLEFTNMELPQNERPWSLEPSGHF